MQWQALQREVAEILPDHPALDSRRPIIFVDSKQQRLHLIDRDPQASRSYPISTARNGLGNQVDSFMTPTGIHRIRQMIGEGQPSGMIFESREPTGNVACDLDNRNRDEITSRILWLDGLEAGINRDGGCDSFSRYIYIHGTSDERRIGQPVSAGCIRMKNADVIELFDAARVDDLAIIR